MIMAAGAMAMMITVLTMPGSKQFGKERKTELPVKNEIEMVKNETVDEKESPRDNIVEEKESPKHEESKDASVPNTEVSA